MLSIFICDDDLMLQERLKKIIQNYIMIEELDMKLVMVTDNPLVVLEYVEENSETGGLYFLEMDFNHEIDGIALAVQLRALDPLGKIVFITRRGELAFLTFEHKIEALDYIIKDVDIGELKSKIVHCVQVAHDRQLASKKTNKHYFTIKVAGKTEIIPIRNIMFVETSNVRNRLLLHLENSKFHFRGTMKEVENHNPAFVRVHHAIVANKHSIKSIDAKKMEIEFVNGETCLVSVRKLGALEKALSEKG